MIQVIPFLNRKEPTLEEEYNKAHIELIRALESIDKQFSKLFPQFELNIEYEIVNKLEEVYKNEIPIKQ